MKNKNDKLAKEIVKDYSSTFTQLKEYDIDKKQTERSNNLAYAAGLIDGEGCIGMYLNSHNGNYQLRISVEMGDLRGLEVLEILFGGKWYYRPAKKPCREKWTWMLFNAKAFEALRELEPYMYVKREHAKIIQSADWINFKGKPLNENEKKIRQEVATKIKKLNERGYYGEADKSERRSWSKKS